MQKPNYGIDAPDVVRNLLIFGALALSIAAVLAGVGNRGFAVPLLWMGSSLFLSGILMLLYALFGKFRHRDRMLDLIAWRGDERVLDVGTGRGLLAIGAAKRLPGGKAIGIDVWSERDLSGNSPRNAKANAALEGIADRVEIRSEDAHQMSFLDASFDVVLSNLCLHNIEARDGRAKACREIARVLKPGGTAIISDFQKTREYAAVFELAGCEVERSRPYVFDTFPPLRIVTAIKPA